jgi:hypothetical protein
MGAADARTVTPWFEGGADINSLSRLDGPWKFTFLIASSIDRALLEPNDLLNYSKRYELIEGHSFITGDFLRSVTH